MANNLFDETLEDLDAERTGAPARNPFLETLESIERDQAMRLRGALRQASGTSPEQAAEARRLSLKFGVPPSAVLRDLATWRSRDRVDGQPLGAIAFESPALAGWLESPDNAAVASDDLPALRRLDQTLTFGASIKRGIDSVQGLTFGALEAAASATGAENLEATFRAGRERNRAEQEAAGPRTGFLQAFRSPWQLTQWAKETIGEQIPIMGTMLAGAATGAAIGSVVPVLGTSIGGLIGAFVPALAFGVGEVQQAIKDIDPDGDVPAAAFLGGSAIAALDTLLPGRIGGRLVATFGRQTAEAIARRALLAPVRQGFVRATAGGMATEGFTEAIQEAIGAVAAAMGTDTAIDAGEVWTQMIEAGAAGALLGGVTVAGEQVTTRRRAEQALALAQQQQAIFDALAQGTADSALVKRLPEAAQAFIAQATKDGPLETVYAPTESWVTYWQSKGVDPATVAAELTGNPDALAEATAAGADLPIPTAAYAVKIAPTEHHAFFAQELKLDPALMNRREAEQFHTEQLAALEAEAAAAAGAPGEPGAAPSPVTEPTAPGGAAQGVAEEIRKRLAPLGFDAATIDAYARLHEGFFGQTAERATGAGLGFDPVQMLDRYGMDVSRPDLQQLLRTPAPAGEPVGGLQPALGGLQAAGPAVSPAQVAGAPEAGLTPAGEAVVAGAAPVDIEAAVGETAVRAAATLAAQAGPGLPELAAEQPSPGEGGRVEGLGEGDRAQLRRLPSPDEQSVADLERYPQGFIRAEPEADAARFTTEVTRELDRIAEELAEFPFVERTWHWIDPNDTSWGNAAGGQAQVTGGAAGAPVYDDILDFAPLNRGRGRQALAATVRGTRGQVEAAIRTALESRTLHNNLAEGAMRVAERRAAGDYRFIGKPLLPPSWGDVASDELTDALDAALDDALEFEGEIEEFEQAVRPALPLEDVLETGEVQPRLPGAEEVREVEQPTPKIEAPFGLRPPSGEVGRRSTQQTLFQPAWHGSPHVFDRFSLHAIGNGEGAQSYGWGLYFSSTREIAEWYREKLAGQVGITLDGHELNPAALDSGFVIAKERGTRWPELTDADIKFLRHVRNEGGVERAFDLLGRIIAEDRAAAGPTERTKAVHAAGQRLMTRIDTTPAGRVYKVEIPEAEDFLDYDLPASQQSPKVQAALRALGLTWTATTVPSLADALTLFGTRQVQRDAASDIGIRETLREGQHYATEGNEAAFRPWFYKYGGLLSGRAFDEAGLRIERPNPVDDPTGQFLYETLQAQQFRAGVGFKQAAEAASRTLAAAGVAGLRYLDGVSRVRGEGSHNYVVFDESVVQIVEYYQSADPKLSAVHQLSAENLKIAGEMGGLPAPSIAVVPEGSGALTGYGDVTLIGGRELADPTLNPVFDADAYTATFPTPEYANAKRGPADALVTRFLPLEREFEDTGGLTSQLWDNAIERANPRKNIDLLRRSLAGKAGFLRERGVTVQPIRRPARVEVEFITTDAFQQFLDAEGGIAAVANHSYTDEPFRRRFADAVSRAIHEHVAEKDLDAEDTLWLEKVLRDAWFDDDGFVHFGYIIRIERSLAAIGREDVDRPATEELLDRHLAGTEPAFATWVENLVLPMHGPPRLTVGRRKVPYTVENIVAKMTEGPRVQAVQETMTFGEGRARAAAAVRIGDITELRNRAAGQIRPEAEIEAPRARAKELLAAWRDAVIQHYTGRDWQSRIDTWGALDASMRAIARWAKGMSLERALAREGFAGVPKPIVAQGVEAGRAFLDAPVPYFESKPQRVVRLEEFAGAVIPTTASDDTRQILTRAGVRFVEYDPEDPPTRTVALNALRSDLAREREDVLFQERRGAISFGPDRRFSIKLFAKADLSTFLHESAHLFFEVFADVAEQVQQVDPTELTSDQRQMLADYGAMLQFLGHERREDVTRDDHERFARAFEAYLMEGRAPSLTLREAFARFRSWLLGIYRTLRGLNVEINDQVRQVFDRMLASEAAIAEASAEGVRQLFTTPDAAGMTEAEFTLYRRRLEQAHQAARETLDRRLMAEVQREREATWKARRDELEAAITAELEAQPVYRALWAITRGTQPNGDPLEPGLAPTPMRLSRQILIDRYGEGRQRRLPPFATTRTGGVDPDTVAELFGFSSGDALLTALVEAPPLRALVRARVDDQMVREHGSLLLDGSVYEAARAAVANEDRDEVIRAELRALANLKRTVGPFVAAERRRGTTALQAAQRERAYERRWLEAEAQLRIAIAEGRQQVEIDRLRSEVNALKAKARGGPAAIRSALPPVNTVRQTARERIARLRIRDIRPQHWWTAAAQASRRAVEAAARQDFDAAIAAKQQELLAVALYREAVNALEEVERRLARAKDLGRPKVRQRLGLAGESYLDQIDGILDRYEFARVSERALEHRASLNKWAAAIEGEGLPVDLPEELLDEARRTNYRNLTVEELIGVTDGLDHIVHLARLKTRLLRQAEKRELDELATTIADNIRQKAPTTRREETRDRRPAEERRRFIESIFAQGRKISSLARELDGFEDGGPLWDAVIRPLNEAGAQEAGLQADAVRRWQQVLDRAYPAREKRTLFQKTHVPALGRSFSKVERLMIALYWGNAEGRQRLTANERWTEQQVQAILDTLDRRDWQFVQDVWTWVNSYWPQIVEKEQRVSGVAPQKVEALAMHTRFGEVSGGYVPLRYDDRQSAAAGSLVDLEDGMAHVHAAYLRTTTKRGHTRERKKRVNTRLKLRLDFGVVTEHVNQVLHDLTHHETLIDVQRILGHAAVQDAVYETTGGVAYKQFKDALRDIAIGDTPGGGAFERAFTHARIGATVAMLGWNFTTGLLQVTGFTQSMQRIGVRWVGRGLSRWLRDAAHMENSARWVTEKSAFMRTRFQTQQRDVRDALREMGVHSGKFTGWIDSVLATTTFNTITKQRIVESFFWTIQVMQRVVDVPTWLGAYEKAMAAGEPEDRAIAIADQAVLDSQGGGQIKDLAATQRGTPALKLWMTFGSFFNTTYNLAVETKRRTRWGKPLSVWRMATDYLLLFTVPATFGYLVRELLRGDAPDDDNDDIAEGIIRENLAYIMGIFPLLRELGGVAQGFSGYEGPAGARIFSSLARVTQQTEQVVREVADTHAFPDETLDEAFFRSVNEGAGLLFHYPATQIWRTVAGMSALIEGRTEDPFALLGGPPREER